MIDLIRLLVKGTAGLVVKSLKSVLVGGSLLGLQETGFKTLGGKITKKTVVILGIGQRTKRDGIVLVTVKIVTVVAKELEDEKFSY